MTTLMKIGIAAIVVAVFGVVLYFYSKNATTINADGSQAAGASSDPTKGRAHLYSASTYKMIASGKFNSPKLAKFNLTTGDYSPWREVMMDEWSSIYGTWRWTFGYDVANPPAGKADVNAISCWAKGMNLNAVKLQGYLFLFNDDIQDYYTNSTVLQRVQGNITPGQFIA